MKKNLSLSVPDLARTEGETVEELVEWLVDYFNAPRVPWSYLRSARINKAAYRGIHSINTLLSGCLLEKNLTSRKANADVVKLAAPLAFGRSTQVFDLSARKFEFGLGFSSGYRIPFFFTEGGIVKLYFLQPRKNYALDKNQISMVATIHKMFVLDVEFPGVETDIEYVDLSASEEDKMRHIKKYSLKNIDLWSYERLQLRLTLIANALRFIQANDLVIPRPLREQTLEDMPLFK